MLYLPSILCPPPYYCQLAAVYPCVAAVSLLLCYSCPPVSPADVLKRHDTGKTAHVCIRLAGPDMCVCVRVAGPDMCVCVRVAGPDMCVCVRVAGPDMCVCARVAGP